MAKEYECWFCAEWVKEKKFMDHLRVHDRDGLWVAFRPDVTFPSSLEECERRFGPIGLLTSREVEETEIENDSPLQYINSA